MSKSQKAKYIIITISTVLNTAFWLWSSVYELSGFIVKNEQAIGFEWFSNNIYLVISVMGFVNAVLLLFGIIMYQKADVNEAVFICPLLLYLCPIGIAITALGLYILYPLIFIFPFVWISCVIACIVLLIIEFAKSRKIKQKPSPIGEG